MNRDSLDRHITGNYGEDQFKGQAEFEAETERLLNLRDKATAAHSGFQVQQAEALLDAHCPDWREWAINAEMPPLDPVEHEIIEIAAGRKLTNEEAQVALKDATILAAFEHWLKTGRPS